MAIFQKFVDGAALTCLILFLWKPFYWFLVHPAIGFWRRQGKGAFWLALPVWSIFALGIFLARHQMFVLRIQRNAITWVAGTLVCTAACWLDSQTRHDFGWRRLSGMTGLNTDHRLCGVVHTGIYGRVRHPRYLLYMLMLMGAAFLTGAVAIFLLAILNILLYQIVAPLEERALLDQYGLEYEAYRRLVPRFVPRLVRTPESRISS